jgi:hypothetical protein
MHLNAHRCPDRNAKVHVLKEMIFPNCERLGQTIIFCLSREGARSLHAEMERAAYKCTSITVCTSLRLYGAIWIAGSCKRTMSLSLGMLTLGHEMLENRQAVIILLAWAALHVSCKGTLAVCLSCA